MQIRLRPEYRGKVLAALLLLLLLVVVLFMNSHRSSSDALTGNLQVQHMHKADIIYGIIFDAGSTGSRIHVIKLRKDPVEGLKYVEELFEQTKSGLSDYADNPEKGAAELKPLLIKAQEYIPVEQWRQTPLALKATAGLRLLPKGKSEALLSEVTSLFEKSPFKVGPKAVQIMEGDDEGVFSWFTFNMLAGAFSSKQYISVMDLGGGSTQITFVTKTPEEVSQAPKGYIIEKDILGDKINLYTHSYLRSGLMSGRLQTVGGSESQESKNPETFTSSCLGDGVEGEFKLGGGQYIVKGKAPESSAYEECLAATKKVVEAANIDKPALLSTDKHKVAIISYYYDRAVETSLIDKEAGGDIQVKQYITAGQKACANPDKKQPFLCLDLCYIITLLKDGFGLKDDTHVMLRKKIDNTEISWALGAMFELLKDSTGPAPAAR